MILKLLNRLRPGAAAKAAQLAAAVDVAAVSVVPASAASESPVRQHQRMNALLDDFRRRIRRQEPAASKAAAKPEAPAFASASASASGQARSLPALRGVEQWLGVAARAASALVVLWVMVSAWGIVSASRALESHVFAVPKLGQFPALGHTKLLAANRLSPDLQRMLTPNEDRLMRAVQNIATFENARAEQTLRATRSVVQAVVEGSAAQRAKVEPGDVVKQVNSKEAGFVWDVYKISTDRPLRLLELTLQRGSETLTASLGLKEGDRFDLSNLGLLFPVPDTIRFIGLTDAERITEQLRSGYVEQMPPEWQIAYVEGLLGVSNELVANLSTLNAAAYSASNYLRSEELLGWYHQGFSKALGEYRNGVERRRVRQTQALLQLGWSLLAGGLMLLLALGQSARTRWAL